MGIGIDKQLDPERSQLRRVLETQFAYERMSAARSMLVHLLAFLGVVVWVTAISPDLLPKEARLFTLIIWGQLSFFDDLGGGGGISFVAQAHKVI